MTLLIKPKVAIDTNVFISGLLYGGNSEKILHLFKNDRFELIISPQTQAELLIKLPKFELSGQFIDNLDTLIQTKSIKIVPKKKVKIARDPKDNMFLELCLAGGADYLVTGDKDLLSLKSFKNTLILSPKDFLKIFT